MVWKGINRFVILKHTCEIEWGKWTQKGSSDGKGKRKGEKENEICIPTYKTENVNKKYNSKKMEDQHKMETMKKLLFSWGWNR